jgi:hypothetical protein
MLRILLRNPMLNSQVCCGARNALAFGLMESRHRPAKDDREKQWPPFPKIGNGALVVSGNPGPLFGANHAERNDL